MILKIFLTAVIFFINWLMKETVFLGRKFAKEKYPYLRARHKRFARIILWTIVIAVIVVEVMIRLKGGVKNYDFLLIFHISVAVIYLLLLILLNSKFSGEKSPRHKYIAYTCLVFFFVTIMTAVPIIWRL